jgi:antitoxin (DNA-binding transcriptional repressor) of toxin-antitoxin stability system
MSDVLTIYEAKTNLSKYVKLARAGKPSYIGSYGEKQVVLISADAIPEQKHSGKAIASFLRES